MNLDKLYSFLAGWLELRKAGNIWRKGRSAADEEAQIMRNGFISEPRLQTGGETERERDHRFAAGIAFHTARPAPP